MTTICLTGWQQQPDSLRTIAPHAQHVDYSACLSRDALYAMLPRTIECAIGWSLGGQLLLQATLQGVIAPKSLYLLGAPFQCLADAQFPYGMSLSDFDEVYKNYRDNPRATVFHFNSIVGLGGKKTARIIQALTQDIRVWDAGLYWLEYLKNKPFENMRATHTSTRITILHGSNDKIIHPENARYFLELLPHTTYVTIPDCGHAIHLSHPHDVVQQLSSHV